MSYIPGQKPKSIRKASVPNGPFEETYLRYLRKDNRTYDDAEVRELPDTFFYNLHKQEWEMRAKTVQRLLKYISRPNEPANQFRMLEIGCGNGWLSARIAQMPQFNVVGLDVNYFELEQAARVFPFDNLDFVYGDLFDDIFPEESFDVVVLFDTIQFFPNLQQLINRCRQYLKKGGELHILESPIYQEKDLEQAAKQTLDYYQNLGLPEMAELHHHHSRKDLASFDYQFLYRPGGLGKLLGQKGSEYPWVKIVN
jgi:ubiquinone/menaquinone biosynthesis C-methylase UbiE